jgi:heparan-alpha-glucosaminide N-acetyltransferase
MDTSGTIPSPAELPAPAAFRPPRIMSIDAVRGLVMFTMIFVNDLAGNDIVPDWMNHFSDRHASGSGMTFVDLVFPGFLFIVGMSIPFALGSRLAKGESPGKILLHILGRTLSLLLLGIMMVNESPNTQAMGWSATWWTALMYLSAILAFCGITPRSRTGSSPEKVRRWQLISLALRVIGFASLFWLALAFQGKHNHHILTLSPFSIHYEWYGILGLIGWAYAIGAVVYLMFRNQRTALLGCLALLMCFFPADKAGFFSNCPISHFVDFQTTLGSQPAITVAGVLLATILLTAETAAVAARIRFTLLFIGGFSAAALLLNGLYGISKNEATPSWCFWSCANTATFWLLFYLLADVKGLIRVARPFAVAGQNVLLAYLISEGSESFLGVLHLGDWYDRLAQVNLLCACARSAACAVVILAMTAGLNRLGFYLKL